MCGIAGILSFSQGRILDEEGLKRMAEPLKYRGPDQEGYLLEESRDAYIHFAHKRLSIIDLSDAGRQPMESGSGNSVIVFNGEIYNYPLIREDLKRSMVAFKSHSDTEVILEAYEKYGIEKTLELLDGMFAFALFDRQKSTLYLARDRFGKKPLYYSQSGDTLAFSSDIRSFNIYPGNLTLDEYALGYYFREMSTPIGHSIWKEVKKVLPGHFLEIKGSSVRQQKFWDAEYKEKQDVDLQQAIDQSEFWLEKAVTKRLIADVDVGTFLSGGVDSSLVTYFAAKNYDRKLKTFSVGFSYEEFNELPHAKKVAEVCETDHHEIVLNPQDVDVIDKLIDEYGEPFADSSMIPSYYVSQFAASKLKVTLGGDGGDELFGGYATYIQGYRMDAHRQKLGMLSPLVRLAAGMSSHPRLKYLDGVLRHDDPTIASALYRNMGFKDDEMERLFPGKKDLNNAMDHEYLEQIRAAAEHANTPFDELLYASLKTRLVNDYLVKVDRASMYNSLEVRVPFLDKDLLAFTGTLDREQILHNEVPKYLTKKIAEKYLPHDVIYRPKQGFGIPIGEWFRTDLKKHAEEIIFGLKQDLIDIDYDEVKRTWDLHQSRDKEYANRLWIVYVFHKWADMMRS